nr:MAG TPA: hypothetical protein [Inoviridae sp.]
MRGLGAGFMTASDFSAALCGFITARNLAVNFCRNLKILRQILPRRAQASLNFAV